MIDGRGGYANTDRLAHKLQKSDDGEYPTVPVTTVSTQDENLDLDLNYYDQDSAGFLRFTVTTEKLTIDSFTVPFDGGFEDIVRDTVTVTREGRIDQPSAGGRRRRR